MKLWPHKETVEDYRNDIEEYASRAVECGNNIRGGHANLSYQNNMSAEYGDPSGRRSFDYKYEQMIDNIHHFVIMGLLAIDDKIIRTIDKLNTENFTYIEDNYLFEEYLVLYCNEKTVTDTAEMIIPEDREQFLADAQKVADAIGFEIK